MTLILASTQTTSSAVTAAVPELVILSLPSLIYVRRLRRSGRPRDERLTTGGLRPGTPSTYALALALVIPVAGLGAILLQSIPTSVLHGGSKNLTVTGVPRTAGDYAAIVLPHSPRRCSSAASWLGCCSGASAFARATSSKR